MKQSVSEAGVTDPRQIRTRAIIEEAAIRLLTREGPSAVTHQRVAAESGVGRATVYRHWPTTRELLLHTILGSELPFFVDPTVPVRDWLVASLRTLVDRLALPEVGVATLTLMHQAQWDEEVAARRDAFFEEVERRLSASFDLARTAEGLRPALDVRAATAALIGPLLHLTLFRNVDVSDDLLAHLVADVLRDEAVVGTHVAEAGSSSPI